MNSVNNTKNEKFYTEVLPYDGETYGQPRRTTWLCYHTALFLNHILIFGKKISPLLRRAKGFAAALCNPARRIPIVVQNWNIVSVEFENRITMLPYKKAAEAAFYAQPCLLTGG